MTSSCSSSSTARRRASVSSSWDRSVICFDDTTPESTSPRSRCLAGADLGDLLVELRDVAAEVADRRCWARTTASRRARSARLGLLDRGLLGQGAAAVLGAGELGVEAGEVEQPALGGGVGLHEIAAPAPAGSGESLAEAPRVGARARTP